MYSRPLLDALNVMCMWRYISRMCLIQQKVTHCMEQYRYRLTGDYRSLEKDCYYTVVQLSQESNIKLETLRERLARRGSRDVVLPSDLDPVGKYRSVAYRLERDSHAISQKWLSTPLVGVRNAQ